MKQKFSASCGISKAKAQIYGETLQRIASENSGLIKPAVVVNEARREESPLHEYFVWDDSKAAEQYRLVQARNLINHIEVTVIHGDEERKTKAFFNVSVQTEESGKEQRYVPVDMVSCSEDLREQVIAKALSEVIAWKERYKTYKELKAIFSVIDKIGEKLNLNKEK